MKVHVPCSLVVFLVSLSCSAERDPLSPPDGYEAFLREELAEGVQVQLSAPADLYNENPGYYDRITLSALGANDSETAGFVNMLGITLDLQPNGLSFAFPLYMQVTWPEGRVTAAESERAILFNRSHESARWRPVQSDTMDYDARIAGAWLDHFSQFVLEIPPLSIESVILVEPAIDGRDITLTVSPPSALERYTPECEKCTLVMVDSDRVKLRANEGVVRFSINASQTHALWEQDVYVSGQGAAQDYILWQSTAEKYSPTLKFSRNYGRTAEAVKCKSEYLQDDPRDPGSYWPLGMEFFFSGNISLGIKNRWFAQLLSGAEAVNYLTGHSSIHAVIDGQTSGEGLRTLRGQKIGSALYWQLEDNVSLSTLPVSAPARRVFLTYWMFYAWDMKSPELKGGAHTLDRESMTVELLCADGPESCDPQAVWYAGHVEGQRLYILDPVNGKSVAGRWHGDALRVPWEKVDRSGPTENSPVAYVAYGSHALYPRPAIYYVDPDLSQYISLSSDPSAEGDVPKHFKGGTEAACGDDEIFVRKGAGEGTTYEIRALDISQQYTSGSPEAVFLFSGYFIDGLKNDRFPPFIRRYHSQSDWANLLLEKNDSVGWCKDASCLAQYPLSCGDGVVGPGEECDMGVQNSDNAACTHRCEKARCGDGLKWTGEEECDNGDLNGATDCTSDCREPSAPEPSCGGADPEGSVWVQIDFGPGETVDSALVTFSPTPGWQEAEWALDLIDVNGDIMVVDDQIGRVAQIVGDSQLRMEFSTLGFPEMLSPYVCLVGRSISVSGPVTVDAVSGFNNCGGSAELSNSWELHEGVVNLPDDCLLANQPLQSIDIFPSGGSFSFGAKSVRVVLK